MIVNLYTFSKRKNSTQRPSGAGLELECYLKSPSSVVSPTLELQAPANPCQYNYCYIAQFSRYYFVKEWSYDGTVWTATLSCDVLASFKTNIQSTTAFVERSASSYNLDIVDPMIVSEGYKTSTVNEVSVAGLSGTTTYPNGTFAITVLDTRGSDATGGSTTYFMSVSGMRLFAQDLVNGDGWEKLKQFFNNPLDAYIDSYYIPFDVASYLALTETKAVIMGDYVFPHATGQCAVNTNMCPSSKHATIAVPRHYTDFRNLAPYTTYQLFFPFCGAREIAASDLYDQSQIQIDYSVDFTSGAIQAIAYAEGLTLATFEGNCRVGIPIAASQSMISYYAGLAGGAVAGGKMAGGLGAIGGAALAAVSQGQPDRYQSLGQSQGSCLGAVLGGGANMWQKIKLTGVSHSTQSSPSNIRSTQGNMLQQSASLGSLSGYVKCRGASVSAPATEGELSQINAYLDTGAFLE